MLARNMTYKRRATRCKVYWDRISRSLLYLVYMSWAIFRQNLMPGIKLFPVFPCTARTCLYLKAGVLRCKIWCRVRIIIRI